MFRKIKNMLGGVTSYLGTHAALRSFDDEVAQLNLATGKLALAEEEARCEVIAARDRALAAAHDERIHGADIEVLGQFNARINPLVAHGFRRVGDLRCHTRSSLENYSGVGPVTSNSVMDAYARWRGHVKETTGLTLNPDRLTADEKRLIESVARYEAIHRDLPAQIESIRERRTQLVGSIAWIEAQRQQGLLFSAEKQASTVKYVGQIEPFVLELRQSAEAKYQAIRALPSDGPNSPMPRFAANAAWFYAIMDAIAPLPRPPRPFSAPGVQVERPTSGGASRPASPPRPEATNQTRLRPGSQRNRDAYAEDSRNPPTPEIEDPRSAPILEPLAPASDDGIHGELPLAIARAVEALPLEPGPLTATLRRYQQFGAQYMIKQERVLLGDDMGLGKTVQVLAAMCHLHAKGRRHFFVVAPNSVLTNWEREVSKHTRLRPYIVHGTERMRRFTEWSLTGGVAITTYGTIGALVASIPHLDMLAVDEAHFVKNVSAVRTRSVRAAAAKSDFVVFMSGTALENRIKELHTLVVMVQPSVKSRADYLIASTLPAADEARRRVAQVYLRRTQADVLTELPELTKVDEYVQLSPEELNSPEAQKPHLMNRRQATTVGLGEGRSAKYERLSELLEVYRAEGRKVAVFSTFRKVLDDVSALVGGCAQITGDIPAAQRLSIIDAFGAQAGFAVLVLQVEAGGVGLNLQAAQVVVLMEPQFKPSTENQAIARVRRMGQSRNVMVHRLIALDSIDEDLVRLISEKQAIFDAYAQHSAIKDHSEMSMDSAAVQHDLTEELRRRDEERRRNREKAPPPEVSEWSNEDGARTH